MTPRAAQFSFTGEDSNTIPTEVFWSEMYEALIQFKLEHNHCRVPIKFEDNPQLGSWVGRQRYSKSLLSEEKIKRLDDIGFDWNPAETFWNEMYENLTQFKLKHKHCRVPANYKVNPQLGSWVNAQRVHKNKLSVEKLNKLNEIDFVWSLNQSSWNEMYEALLVFKKENNHCKVPKKYKTNEKLGSWVSTQRTSKDTLSEEKKQLLNDIGFDWNPSETTWNEMYDMLVQFKKENKHCRIPGMYKGSSQLRRWVYAQRTNKNALTEDKIQRLEAIDFNWSLR